MRGIPISSRFREERVCRPTCWWPCTFFLLRWHFLDGAGFQQVVMVHSFKEKNGFIFVKGEV